MNVFIIGITGGVGGLLAQELHARGAQGMNARVGDLCDLTVEEFAAAVGEVEHYFVVKNDADIALSRSGLNWLVLRPSLLLDGPGAGTVSLGPAESHGQIAREDVAGTLAELLHESRIGRQILELNAGSTPKTGAVRANVRDY